MCWKPVCDHFESVCTEETLCDWLHKTHDLNGQIQNVLSIRLLLSLREVAQAYPLVANHNALGLSQE